MRTRLLLPVLLVAALAPPASGKELVGKVAYESCAIEARYDATSCTVVLRAGRTLFGVSVWSGEGWGSIRCDRSGYARTFGGGYGSDVEYFYSYDDVCHLDVNAWGGRVSADVSPA